MNRKNVIVRSLALLVFLAFLAPMSAFADPATAAEYYEQATQAYQDGDLEKAEDLLNKAYAEDPDLVYQYNRILALDGLGRYEEALQVASALEAPMKADPDNRFEDIGAIKADLQGKVDRQRAEAETETETETEIETASGEIEIETETETETGSSGPNVLAIGLMAGGGALVIPGVLFLSGLTMPGLAADCLGIAPREENPDACAQWNAENRGGEADIATGQSEAEALATTHGIVGVSLVAVGAIAAGVGLVLFLMDGGGESNAAPPNSAFLVAPYIGEDGGGATLRVRF